LGYGLAGGADYLKCEACVLVVIPRSIAVSLSCAQFRTNKNSSRAAMKERVLTRSMPFFNRLLNLSVIPAVICIELSFAYQLEEHAKQGLLRSSVQSFEKGGDALCKGLHRLPLRQDSEGPGLTVGSGCGSDTDLHDVFKQSPFYGLVSEVTARAARGHELHQKGCIVLSWREPLFLCGECLIL